MCFPSPPCVCDLVCAASVGVVSTVVPDSAHKLFIGGLPNYLNDDQVDTSALISPPTWAALLCCATEDVQNWPFPPTNDKINSCFWWPRRIKGLLHVRWDLWRVESFFVSCGRWRSCWRRSGPWRPLTWWKTALQAYLKDTPSVNMLTLTWTTRWVLQISY